MIVEVAVGGGALIVGWLIGRVKKSKPKSPPFQLPPNVYKHQPITGYYCPKCGLGWHYQHSAPKYCECVEFYEGHFHMKCTGTYSKKTVGCGYEWIMMAKDTKR